MSSNLQIALSSHASGVFDPVKTFTPIAAPVPTASDLQPGQILAETLYLSIDPISRKWMEEDNDLTHVPLGAPMAGIGLARVLASQSDTAQAGDLITAWTGWTTYAVIGEDKVMEKFDVPEGARLTDALGLLGATGLTAYFAILRTGKPPQRGETVVVSAAAGATGSVAAQIAKILGARVVGIAGGEEKCRWLKELGLDAVVDYKRADYEQRFAEAVPEGIDVYFDNVGGRTLELAMEKLNKYGRITIVGDLSGYNTTAPQGIKSLFPLAVKSATVHGFSVFEHFKDSKIATADMIKWLREGKLKRTETVVKGGLEAAPQALADLFQGRNTGKMIVEVKGSDA